MDDGGFIRKQRSMLVWLVLSVPQHDGVKAFCSLAVACGHNQYLPNDTSIFIVVVAAHLIAM